MSVGCSFLGRLTSIVLLLGCISEPIAARPPEFIWISDVHFDPTANPELIGRLAKAPVNEWPSILNSSRSGAFSRFGEDTTWPLLNSAFDAIRKTLSNAQFVVVTGDILVHHFRDKFEDSAKTNDDATFRQFATKTMQFMAAQLSTIAPGKPVLVALGNNDSECGDYNLQPHGSFLADSAPALTKWLGALADQASIRDWTALGSYSVRHPVLKNYRVIAVNSVYFSARYNNACSSDGDDPGKEEMEWLARELDKAKAQSAKVWLIFHIAPGLDGYASSHPRNGGPPTTIPMWKPSYTEEFQKLLSRYHDTVTISLAGHEHTDDFRLLQSSLVLLTPALSPVVKQNPAFRVVAFRPDGTLQDASTYYLDNLDALATGAKPDWKFEYSFSKAWNLHQLDFSSFQHLHGRIESEPAVRERWSTFYSVSHPEGSTITKQSFPWLFCATDNMADAGYKTCLSKNGVSEF